MSPYALSASERDFYKENYIHRLYKRGYPATRESMKKFNIRFFDDCNLHGEKRIAVSTALQNFRSNLTKKNVEAHLVKRKPQLGEMLSAIVADYRQKRGVDDGQENGSDGEDDNDLECEEVTEDDENLEEEEEMAENVGAITILENRNEELAKTLKMKDEECQQLEEKVRSLKEALQKKPEKQAQQLKETDLTKLEEENRSLKEALHEKDQMLKAALQVQQTLSTIINKPAPQ